MWKRGNPNIGEEAKKAGTTFKPWQSGNPKWRPKKGASKILDTLKGMWYERTCKKEIEDVYNLMTFLNEFDLRKIGNDKEQPIAARLIAGALLNKKWFNDLQTIVTRIIGTPTNNSEIEHKGYVLTDKESKEIEKLIEANL